MKFVISLLFISALVIFCDGSEISDEEYAKAPALYEMDDYNDCAKKSYIYCKFRFKLGSKITEDTNEIWKIIKKMNQNPEYHDHTVIHRHRCIRAPLDQLEQIIRQGVQIENNLMEKYSLNTSVEEVMCKGFENLIPTAYDYAFLYITVGYLVIIMHVTVVDALIPRIGNRFIKALSLVSNVKNLRDPIQNEDYQRLKSMQGIRFHLMCYVVVGHSLGLMGMTFRKNPKFLEDARSLQSAKWFSRVGIQAVSVFFMLSAWLVATEIHKVYMARNKITLKDVFRAAVNRYVRILPALAFLVGFERSNWLKIILDGPINDVMEMDNKACKNNWWATLLLINNMFYSKHQCNCLTWYLATDFQLFVISLFLFYIAFKWKMGAKVIILAIAVSWTVHAYVIYINDYGMYIDISLEASQIYRSFTSKEIYDLHMSLYSNFASYGVGLLFGSIYFKYKYAAVPSNKVIKTIWFILFMGLPCTVATLCMYEYPRFVRATLGASIKPLFVTGTAIGVLGMAFNFGGIIKSIYEARFTEIFAKTSFCVYIYHLPVVFARQSIYKNMIEFTDFTFAKIIYGNIGISLLIGLIAYLLIEKPAANMWKIIQEKDYIPAKAKHI